MSLDLGTLAAKLKLDDAEFQATLKRAPATAEQAGRRVGEKVQAGARPGLVKLGGLFAGLGIAKMTGDLLGFGLSTAMGMEKASISFTTMLGSGKKAQAFLSDLKNFAAKTPFEFPELQTAASSLISAGIHANKVIPIMTTLGDVTSGMGTGSEGVKRATVALQQMAAAGKITGEDLNQLRDAGIPVYDLLAKATGRSKAEVAKLAQAGKLGGKDLAAMMKALETGKGLERFKGLMSNQSQSLEGIISTLKDTVGQGLADALTPMIPSIKEGIGAFTKALPAILGGIKDFGGWVVKNQTWLKQLAVVFGITAAAVLVLNAVMAANPFSLVIIGIAALVAGLLWCYDNVSWFREGVNAAFSGIAAAGTWLWNNALAPALRAIVGGFAWVVQGAADMVTALSNVPGFEGLKGAASTLQGIAAGARAAVDGLKDIATTPPPTVDVKDKASAKADALKKKMDKLRSKIIEAKAKGDTKEVDKLQAKLKKIDRQYHAQIKVAKTGVSSISVKPNAGGSRLTVLARASGGPVARGGLYLVGEMGPELVRFGASGHVYNNRQTRQMLSRGPSAPARPPLVLNVTNHYPQAEPTSVTTNRTLQTAAALGRI